jgi:glyoxylase-like metal-dependent hydrolase (beta-lactamase superfamily II)
VEPDRLAAGLWRWTARHPEWHPGEFGREVASFALRPEGGGAGGEGGGASGVGGPGGADDLILIDPLLPPDPEPVLDLIGDQLDGGGRLTILISVPYHVRSSEEVRRRFRKRAETTIWGHPACRKRLREQDGFRELAPGDELPAGISAHAIGKPRRHEMPLFVPSHRALVFGDALAEVDGELRVWSDRRVDAGVSRFYHERFNPTLEPLLELDFDRVLVTHGRPILRDGKRALERALVAEPWYRPD